jgi:hypothetical protein
MAFISGDESKRDHREKRKEHMRGDDVWHREKRGRSYQIRLGRGKREVVLASESPANIDLPRPPWVVRHRYRVVL